MNLLLNQQLFPLNQQLNPTIHITKILMNTKQLVKAIISANKPTRQYFPITSNCCFVLPTKAGFNRQSAVGRAPENKHKRSRCFSVVVAGFLPNGHLVSLTSLGSISAVAHGHIFAQVQEDQIIKAVQDILRKLMCGVYQLHLVLYTLYQTAALF